MSTFPQTLGIRYSVGAIIPFLPLRKLALALTVVLAGCGETRSAHSTPPPPVPITPVTHRTLQSAGAAVEIRQPQRGAHVASTMTIRVRIRNFRLTHKHLGDAPKAGQGNLHFMLDHGRYDRPPYNGRAGRLSARLGATGLYSVTTIRAITYYHLPPGSHNLTVQLANNDGSPAGGHATTTFTVGRLRR